MTEPIQTPAQRDIDSALRGNPYKAIVRLAWPATVAMLLHTLFTITDAIWVGRLGAAPIAAVISSSFIVWILLSLTEVLATGVVATVSRSIGAGEFDKAASISEETFRFALLYAAFITILGLLFRGSLFDLQRLEPDVTAIGTTYMGIYFAGAVFVVFTEWAGAIFRAAGNTRIPFLVHSFSIVLNVVLDPFLIFGWGPFPAWGAAGAAVATVIAYAVGSGIAVVFLLHNRLPFPFRMRPFGIINWPRMWRIVMIGVPISAAWIVFSTVYLFINRITAQFGTEAVAALGIGNRIESINYLISYGFSIAVATLVGQNLGNNNPQRAKELAFKAVGMVSAFTGLMTVIFLAFPETLMRIFIDDPGVLAAGKNYVRILAISQIMMAWEVVFEGGFVGAGNTLPPMLVGTPGAIARIPVAWFLAVYLGLGVDGIW
ncbi:MAG: MATE family efflux transporter, partial [candidate division Zixibacteria bacterium]|nr:MATE family efflux transporter [candidate division Zixibacteria bacterium]